MAAYANSDPTTIPVRAVGFVAILFGGALALGTAGGKPAVTVAPAAGGPPAAVTLKWGEDKSKVPLYYQPFRNSVPGGPRSDDDTGIRTLANKNDLKPIVVTLPDPVLSRLGYRFDLGLESIERAMETQGYVLDRWWLPWELNATSGKDADKSTPARILAGADPRKDPGVVLLRQLPARAADPDKPGMVALVLVGETPTAGVHREAFRKALDIHNQISAAVAGAAGRPGAPPPRPACSARASPDRSGRSKKRCVSG